MGTTGSDAAAEARRRYVTAAVMTASPEKLVVLLYDGALRELSRASHELEKGRRNAAGAALRRALAIVGELRASLDLEAGGEIATNLFALYGFVTSRIVEAGVEPTEAPIAEAKAVLSRLKEGWEGITRGS
jgi:flagellar protein FliS